MPDIQKISEIVALSNLLAPGFIILWVRGRFRYAVSPRISDQVISYAIVAVVYTAAAHPLFHANTGIVLPTWLWSSLLNLLMPLVVGLMLVFFDQSEKFYEWSERLNLNPVHHMQTAWDYTFRSRGPCYVIVHLNDGSLIQGAWVKTGLQNGDGFASSLPDDRDVYISQMWSESETGQWLPLDPPRSILIRGSAIQKIEFIQGGSHERQ